MHTGILRIGGFFSFLSPSPESMQEFFASTANSESINASCEGEFPVKAVSVEDLQPGMVLARTLTNDDMVVVLSEGTVLAEAHMTRLKVLNIPVVYVKDEYELSKIYRTATTVFNRGNAFIKDYEGIVDDAQEIFDDIKKGELSVEKTQEVVDDKLAPLTQSSGVIDHLYNLNHLASDIYNHSLRVSVLAGVIAKWMHFDRKRTKELILAGFLHDIGKIRFDRRLLEKDIDKLQGEDYEAYTQHTVDGQQILNGMNGISKGIKLAAMQHHERMDGSGFPFGTMGPDIHEYARIIAIADIYDNITTEREGRVKRTPFAAISYFAEHLYTTLDPMVCVPVLTHIKDAFLGSSVTLNNGVTGTISSYPNDFAARPVVSTESGALDLNHHPELDIIEYNPK